MEKNETLPANNLNCPTCQQLDRVQKVTSIVSENTRTATSTTKNTSLSVLNVLDHTSFVPTFSRGSTTSTGSSELARMLSRPVFDYKAPLMETNGFIEGVAVLIFFCGINALLGLPWFLSVPFHGSQELFIALLIVMLIMIPFGIWGFRYTFFTRHKVKAKLKEAWDQKMVYQRQIWDKYNWCLAAWERLFYCYRCDNIFLPGGIARPAYSVVAYLFECYHYASQLLITNETNQVKDQGWDIQKVV